MGKYFLLKFKSLLKVFPYVALALVILIGCLFAAFGFVYGSADDDQTRFKLALVCSENDPYFMAGLEVVQGYDSTRFSIDTQQMSEEEAHEALKQGLLDAYVVIPEGYISNAMSGELGSLKYVSSNDTADLTTLFKDEITGVVSNIIITCEKAMYGVDAAADDFAFEGNASTHAHEISLRYVDYILDRTDMYYVDQLGIHDSLGFDGYLFAGISVLILSVVLIPVALCFVNQDLAVLRLLKSKNIGAGKQVVGEFLAFAAILLIPVCGLCVLVTVIDSSLTEELKRIAMVFSFENFGLLLLAVLTLAAFAYFIMQLADEFVGGTLLYFFAALALCFVSGCIYPVYFFPDILKNISMYTPQGLARELFGGAIVRAADSRICVSMAIYTAVLLSGAGIIRAIHLRGAKR